MNRVKRPSTSRHTTLMWLVLSVFALAVPATASAAVSVARAELTSGELRVEGRGAVPNATVTVTADSVGRARADGSGEFRVEADGFLAADCRATVSDGATSDEVTLADCTVSSPAPTPEPEPEPSPTPTPTPSPTPTTSTFVIVDDVLPDGYIGTAYSGSLFSRGASGDKPVEYRIVAGQLPAGLSLTRSFGVASALITGTPTTVGTSSLTVEARDGDGNRTRKSFSITIHPPLPLVITNPSDALAPGMVGVGDQIQLFANVARGRTAGRSPPGSSRPGSRSAAPDSFPARRPPPACPCSRRG